MSGILFTGFAPFGSDTVNGSWEAVRALPDRIGNVTVYKRELPVVYDRVRDCLTALLDELRPRAVVCVGQAAGRTAVTPELVAVNWRSGAIADNDGIRYDGVPIDAAKPAAYFSTLPVRALTEALCAEGIPAYLSLSAGGYVCNSTMYHLLDLLRDHPEIPAGFVHVPYLSTQAAQRPNVASLPLATVTAALECIARRLCAAET